MPVTCALLPGAGVPQSNERPIARQEAQAVGAVQHGREWWFRQPWIDGIEYSQVPPRRDHGHPKMTISDAERREGGVSHCCES